MITLTKSMSFSLMAFIYDAAQECQHYSATLSPDARVDAMVSHIQSSAPDDISFALSEIDVDELRSFIEKGVTSNWAIYGRIDVIDAADRFFTTTDVMANTPAPASAVSLLVDHDDQYRTICLSTLHLSPRTRAWLETQAAEMNDVVNRDYGFIIMIHDKLFNGKHVPIDLDNVIRQCSLAGYMQILFDTQASINPALPVLEVEM